MNAIRRTTTAILPLAMILVWTGLAAACPTCKESLAHDPASANLARGYAYSILFMLSMPPLIFGSLALYFYWLVRKERLRAASASRAAELAPSPQ